MMNTAGRIGCDWMTGQAGYSRMRRGADTLSGITVNLKPVGHNTNAGCIFTASGGGVTGGAGILMNTFDDTIRRDWVAGGGASIQILSKIRSGMAGVRVALIVMTVKTADSYTILNNGLDACIARRS